MLKMLKADWVTSKIPIIDAQKEIASKKDYFDVLQTLELSVGYLQKYNDPSEPRCR